MSVLDGLVDRAELVLKILDGLLGLLVIIDLLLLLLLFALLNLLSFLAALLLDRLPELDIDGDLVEFTEIARDGDLDDRGVVLKVEQQLIQVHVHAGRSGVEEYQILLDLTDPANGGLQDLLNVDAFLWVHHLVVAFLELTVDINVFHVQASEMLEDLIWGPGVDYLNNLC